MTTLIIGRHGNTFDSNMTPTRVGARTDLPLVKKGREQARAMGAYLKKHRLIPDVVYASHLQRTKETAALAIKESNIANPVYCLDIFNEIDYGPDENKTEKEVIARISEQAIKDWDEKAKVPEGWNVDPDQIIKNWKNFADQIKAHDDNETVFVVTSNGIARFAPVALLDDDDFESFSKTHTIKISTGALCILKYQGGKWTLIEWNLKP